MANQLTVGSQKLTRDQLAKILPDLRSIKFFENLIADLQNAASAINDRDQVNVWTKNQSTAQFDLTDAPIVALDASQSNAFRLLLNAGVGVTRKLANPTNATAGMLLSFEFVQPAAGGCALTFDTLYDFGPSGAPALAGSKGAIDLMLAYFDGTKMVCLFRGTGGFYTVQQLTDAPSIPFAATSNTIFQLQTTSAVGSTRQLANPTGTIPGQTWNMDVQQPASGGPCALTFGTSFVWGRGGQDPQPIGSVIAGSTDTYSFEVRADGHIIGVMIGQSGPTGAGYMATSTTSLTPGAGARALATQAGLAYTTGARARATSASTGDYFEGVVASYASSTLTITADTFSGSTARTDWNINVAGNVGNPGPQGVAGPAGIGNGVNIQTGTTYTYLNTDASKLVSHSNAANIAATLPQATGTFASPWAMDVENTGVGNLVITPTTSAIDGAASLTLSTNQGCRIFADGTGNYKTQRGIGGGGATGVNIQTGTTYSFQQSDNNSVVVFNNTSFCNATLPVVFPAGWHCWVKVNNFYLSGGSPMLGGYVNIGSLYGYIDHPVNYNLLVSQGETALLFSDGSNYYSSLGFGKNSQYAVVSNAATYTYNFKDNGNLIVHNCSTAVAATLTNSSNEPPRWWSVFNAGALPVTISSSVFVINGAASFILQAGQGTTFYLDNTTSGTAGYWTTNQPKGGTVNVQSGTTYTYAQTDYGKLVSHGNSAAMTGTLPNPNSGTPFFFPYPFYFWIQNRGPGTLTLSATSPSTIDGGTSLVLTANHGCYLASDGTNWYTTRG